MRLQDHPRASEPLQEGSCVPLLSHINLKQGLEQSLSAAFQRQKSFPLSTQMLADIRDTAELPLRCKWKSLISVHL